MICNTFGEIIPALALISLGFVDADHKSLAVTLLIVSVAINIAIFCGHHANHMDLSPNFAGPLMGFTNAAANVCSILAPLIHGYIVEDPVSFFFFYFTLLTLLSNECNFICLSLCVNRITFSLYGKMCNILLHSQYQKCLFFLITDECVSMEECIYLNCWNLRRWSLGFLAVWFC